MRLKPGKTATAADLERRNHKTAVSSAQASSWLLRLGGCLVDVGPNHVGRCYVPSGEAHGMQKLKVAPEPSFCDAHAHALRLGRSAIPHPHGLHLGNYSVHTSAQALQTGERRILSRGMLAGRPDDISTCRGRPTKPAAADSLGVCGRKGPRDGVRLRSGNWCRTAC